MFRSTESLSSMFVLTPGCSLAGIGVVPKYFYVPEFAVEDERKNPGSQEKLPSSKECLSLWDQSLYIIVKLLGRYMRFVAFLVSETRLG